MASDRVVLYGNVAFSILVLSTKKLLEKSYGKVFVFQKICFKVKGVVSGLTQFVAPEIPLKMMKNAFHFTLKAFRFQHFKIFVLTFLS